MTPKHKLNIALLFDEFEMSVTLSRELIASRDENPDIVSTKEYQQTVSAIHALMIDQLFKISRSISLKEDILDWPSIKKVLDK